MMAEIGQVTGFFGSYNECLTILGAVAGACILLKFLRTFLCGIRTFFLSGPLGLALNPKKCGEWAGKDRSKTLNRTSNQFLNQCFVLI